MSVGLLLLGSVLVTRGAGSDLVRTGLDKTQLHYQVQFGWLASYIGDALNQHWMVSHDGAVSVLDETVRDRLRGYPDCLTATDPNAFAPFQTATAVRNITTGAATPTANVSNANASSFYPWTHDTRIPRPHELLPPQDNETDALLLEHLGETRKDWYNKAFSALSTTHPVFLASQSPDAAKDRLHQYLSDFAPPVMKAMYEYYTDIYSIGIYLGSGATVVYPGRNIRNDTGIPNDIGCDWLDTINNNGATVTAATGITARDKAACRESSTSTFHPLRTEWCRNQVLHPNQFRVSGPHPDPFDTDLEVITFGRSMVDRLTNQWIGCVALHVPVQHMHSTMKKYQQFGSGQALALVGWDDDRNSILAGFPKPPPGKSTIGDGSSMPAGVSHVNNIKRDLLAQYHNDKRLSLYGEYVEPYFVAARPLPLPPTDRYDPTYSPQLLLIVTMDLGTQDAFVGSLNVETEQKVDRVVRYIVVICSVGLLVLLVMMIIMTVCITIPLKWIARTGDKVLKSVGANTIEKTRTPWFHRFAPKTEITMLMEQFQTMMEQFSGGGTAKILKRQLLEVKNPFVLQENFAGLYKTRQEASSTYFTVPTGLQGFRGQPQEGDEQRQDEEESYAGLNDSQDIPGSGQLQEARKHWGPNVHGETVGTYSHGASQSLEEVMYEQETNRRQVLRSRLFWWMAMTIALPLVLILASVSGLVIFEIRTTLPTLTQSLQDLYVELEVFGLRPTNALRSWYLQDILKTSLFDLFMFSRFAGWFYLGALSNGSVINKNDTAAQPMAAMDTFAMGCAAAH